MTARVHLRIRGRVQGVGFRWFARETAERLKVGGWARNLPGGEVEAEAEGDGAAVEDFVAAMRKGCPFSRVDRVMRSVSAPKGDATFDIR